MQRPSNFGNCAFDHHTRLSCQCDEYAHHDTRPFVACRLLNSVPNLPHVQSAPNCDTALQCATLTVVLSSSSESKTIIAEYIALSSSASVCAVAKAFSMRSSALMEASMLNAISASTFVTSMLFSVRVA